MPIGAEVRIRKDLKLGVSYKNREDLKTTTLGNHYCPDCLSEKTVVCGKCGKHVENAPLKRVNSVSYCQECFEQKWVYCVKCGKRV